MVSPPSLFKYPEGCTNSSCKKWRQKTYHMSSCWGLFFSLFCTATNGMELHQIFGHQSDPLPFRVMSKVSIHFELQSFTSRFWICGPQSSAWRGLLWKIMKRWLKRLFLQQCGPWADWPPRPHCNNESCLWVSLSEHPQTDSDFIHLFKKVLRAKHIFHRYSTV